MVPPHGVEPQSKGVLTRLESIYGLLKATSLVVLDVTYS